MTDQEISDVAAIAAAIMLDEISERMWNTLLIGSPETTDEALRRILHAA